MAAASDVTLATRSNVVTAASAAQASAQTGVQAPGSICWFSGPQGIGRPFTEMPAFCWIRLHAGARSRCLTFRGWIDLAMQRLSKPWRAVILFAFLQACSKPSAVQELFRMEMHQVRHFLAAAQYSIFTRAAEACNVAQRSLTRASSFGIPDYRVEVGAADGRARVLA